MQSKKKFIKWLVGLNLNVFTENLMQALVYYLKQEHIYLIIYIFIFRVFAGDQRSSKQVKR